MIQFSLRKKRRFGDDFFHYFCIFLGCLLVFVLTKGNSVVFAQYVQNATSAQNNQHSQNSQPRPNPAPLPMGYNTAQNQNKATGQTNQFVQTGKNAPVPNQHVHVQNVQQRNTVQHREEPVRQEQSDQLLEASVSQAAMQEAVRKIPWNGFTPQAKTKVQSILSGQTLYRRLPQQSVYCEPIMLNFLLDHPDTVVAMWEKLGVTQISLKEHGGPGRYMLRESVGSVGYVEVLYRSDKLCVVYSKGSYKGPFIPKNVEGETILLLQNTFERDEDGEPYVVVQLDAFVKIHNFGADVFAKLFAPMLGKVADNNLEQTIAFIGNVSESAQSNPEVVKRMALKLESVRKEVREEFVQIAYQTAKLAIDRSGDDSLASHPYGRALLESQQNLAKNQNSRQYEQQRQIEMLRKMEAQSQQKLHVQQSVNKPQPRPIVSSNMPAQVMVPGVRQEPHPTGIPRTSVVSIPIPAPKAVEKPAGQTLSLSESIFGSSEKKSGNDEAESAQSNLDFPSFDLGEADPQPLTESVVEVVAKEEPKGPAKVSLIKTDGGAVFKTPTIR